MKNSNNLAFEYVYVDSSDQRFLKIDKILSKI